ncbi:MAG: hypothetical protein JWN61_220 [Pseudonocardiales bacterium]|nr:hypothetical protein [Pseudonocardiales bacterium]
MHPDHGETDPQNQPPAGQPWDASPTPPTEPIDPATGAPAAAPPAYGSAPGGYQSPAGYGSAPGGYAQPSPAPQQSAPQQPTTVFPPVSDHTQVLPTAAQGYGAAPGQQQQGQQPYGQQPTTALPAFGAQPQYGQPQPPQAPQYPQQPQPGQPQYGNPQQPPYGQPGQYQPGGYQGQPVYGAPGQAQAQPKKSKAGLFAIIAVVALLVIGGLGFFLANGPLKKTVLDNGAVASTIERQAGNNGIDVSGVSCPADQEVKADKTFTCSSNAGDITVTITSDDGDWEWSIS